MRRDVSIRISGLFFLLLILLGPIGAFPNLQKQLNNKTAEAEPIATNTTTEGQKINRRVESIGLEN